MTTPPVVDVVELRIPADVAYVSTLRLTAASLASRCDLTVDDIEDLRLAVDEACALLLPHANADAAVTARFDVGDGHLRVRTGVDTGDTGDTAQPDREGIAWMVLGALVSDIDVEATAQHLAITIVKKRAQL